MNTPDNFFVFYFSRITSKSSDKWAIESVEENRDDEVT